MRLVTWNVNSLRARLPRLLELLQRHAPDVACLQETKVDAAGFPEAELGEAGYAAVHHSAGRWAGVALLARHGLQPRDPRYGLAGEAVGDEARWVEATIGDLRVASAYVPNGRAIGTPTFAQKLTFLDAAAARAPELDIVMGDFNVAPSDLDVYDPGAFIGSTHVTPEERGRLGELLGAGFVDAYRRLHPEEVGYTWWDYRQGHFHRGMGLRIDLALVREALSDRLRECGIDRDFRKGPRPSDHAPLLLELG
jgi:exodeoxyribonuclease-3